MSLRKIILSSRLSLGDMVALTAAVRDLHRARPGGFQIDVRTSFPDLWKHNPGLTPLNDYEPSSEILECLCPLVDRSEKAGRHFINGFNEYLGWKLGVYTPLTEFRGDIHLSEAELAAPSPLATLGGDTPFWLVCAGGKDDFTVKWWASERHQEVIDHFQGRLLFVQVGDHQRHHHPRLRGTMDLRGRTTIRELIQLVHHADGIVCGITGLMHLAAAVPIRKGRFPNRPCVVVAGGREPPHWEAYPGHQFISAVGTLPCCAQGGCWRSRVEPLGDGDEKDKPGHICVDVRDGLPRCMDQIPAAEVIRRIEIYLAGGAARTLENGARESARSVLALSDGRKSQEPLNLFNAASAATEFIASIPPYGGGYSGRGIVICGGGVRMFTNAWVCIRMLRRQGCALPIELWHWGDVELDPAMRALVEPFGVQCVDASLFEEDPSKTLSNFWALKPMALLRSKFKEVLLLDADNVPVADPEYLFESKAYQQAGAVLWPDYGRLAPGRPAWKAFGVEYRDEPEVESGQVMMDKERCWRALQLCCWYNQNSDFFYRHIHGDKETFHLAFRRLEEPYAMPSTPIQALPGTMCQHDFGGRRIFQHRNMAKWRLFGDNPPVPGFEFEEECLAYLGELGKKWNGRIRRPGAAAASVEAPPCDGGALPEIRFFASMISCPERDKVRAKTLAKLAETDWGSLPVHVQMDSRRFPEREENITHNGWCALQEGLKADADYILFFEDDLAFNRHLLHNLQHWPRLRSRQVTFATLYNPRFAEVGWDLPPTAFAVDPRHFMGTQAVLISREAAGYFLEHWFEGPAPLDLKMGWLAGRMQWPIFCHNPSLVQHEGRRSIWGGMFHQAQDFDRDWKAPALEPAAAP
ncbi:MAG: hypothetical protein QOF48_1601 [Verrucomicrobiota bacterium]|jgi:ADP-heptose:LPS heptosyltransferase